MEKANREAERLKYELTESIDNKYSNMKRDLLREVAGVKKRYEESDTLVTEASKNLGTLFKNKMIKIKSKLTNFFAEIVIRIEQNNKDVFNASQMVQNFQQTFNNPI